MPDDRRGAGELVEQFKAKAVETLAEDSRHSPILIACRPGENVVRSLAGLGPGHVMWPLVRRGLEAIGAVGYVLAIEAWSAAARPDEIQRVAGGDSPGLAQFRRKPGSPRPSQHPDRIEVLMVAWQFKFDDGSEWDGVLRMPFAREGAESEGEGGTVVPSGEWLDMARDGDAVAKGGMVRLLDAPDYGEPPPILGL